MDTLMMAISPGSSWTHRVMTFLESLEGDQNQNNKKPLEMLIGQRPVARKRDHRAGVAQIGVAGGG